MSVSEQSTFILTDRCVLCVIDQSETRRDESRTQLPDWRSLSHVGSQNSKRPASGNPLCPSNPDIPRHNVPAASACIS